MVIINNHILPTVIYSNIEHQKKSFSTNEKSNENNGKQNPTYVKNSLMVNKRVSEIDHGRSSTFFSPTYMNVLTDLLGDVETFQKYSDYERNMIQVQIDELSYDDFNYKTYLHKSLNASHNLHKLFPQNFENFKLYIRKLSTDQANSQRSYVNTLPFKLKKFHELVVDLLIKYKYELMFTKDITTEDVSFILDEYFTPEVMFNAICVILLKHAWDQMFYNDSSVFDEKAMCVTWSQVIDTVHNQLTLLVVTNCLLYQLNKTKTVVAIDTLFRSIWTFLAYRLRLVKTNSDYLGFIDMLNSVFTGFTQCGIFKDIVVKTKNNKQYSVYYFTNELSNQLGRFTWIPRIYKPSKVTGVNLSDYIISTPFSMMQITPSANLINSLNISNLKRFSVNETYLRVLEKICDIEPFDSINHPIPLAGHIYQLKETLDLFKPSMDILSTKLIDSFQSELSKQHFFLGKTFQYWHIANMTVAELKLYAEKSIISKWLSETRISEKAGNTRVTLAERLQGFPLYFTNTLCSTTWMFAREYILSRHIGCLKLLLSEYTPISVTTEGVINMMHAYYGIEPSIVSDLVDFTWQNVNKKDLEKFFLEHRVNANNEEAVTHYYLIHDELMNVFKHGKTKFMLQIDQVASGLVFMGLLFRNQHLCKYTNLSNHEKPLSPYTHAMSEYKTFYDDHINCKNDKVLQLMVTSKKLHKYALMCYSYNQRSYGRVQDFVERWQDIYGKKPTTCEWKSINEVARKYEDFINHLYPGLDTKIKLLNNIVELVARNAKGVKIRTIEGEIIEWVFYKTKRHIRKSFNPHTLVPESYALYTPVTDREGELVVDIKQFKTKFLSYLIHSMDAAVMRRLIRIMYKVYKYRINHLHDCIMLHPNHVSNLYKAIEDVYTDDVLHDYMNTHVFDVFRANISADKHSTFDMLVQDFNGMDTTPIDLTGVNYRWVYKYEV